jgi:hypothetical protein
LQPPLWIEFSVDKSDFRDPLGVAGIEPSKRLQILDQRAPICIRFDPRPHIVSTVAAPVARHGEPISIGPESCHEFCFRELPMNGRVTEPLAHSLAIEVARRQH